MRRQHAEARARAAEILAEAATARSAVLQAWAAEADEREARRASRRDELVRTLRAGLAELGAELDALRLLAGAGEAADAGGPLPGAARLGRPAGRPAPVDPSTRMADLARGARELLAGGRIAAADEVIRGLEDAAARLRAQADPPPPD
jgi:hypothetical protein